MDLEATCWEKKQADKDQEIIEIGAVKLNHHLEKVDEFNCFVRPVENPVLSNFCSDLTNITQRNIDQAEIFADVFPKFLKWIGKSSYYIISWGQYDIKQIRIDCRKHSLKFPKKFRKKHINLKTQFAQDYRIKPCGMAQALQMLKLPLKGRHHRGIDDARNLVEIFRAIQKS